MVHFEATLEKATKAATILRLCANVVDVFIVGSTARNGVGRDLDLLVTSDNQTAHRYAHDSGMALEYYQRFPGWAWDRELREEVERRFSSIRKLVLGENFEIFFQEAIAAVAPTKIDLIAVVPVDWKNYTGTLELDLKLETGFVAEFARDAIQV